MTGKTKNGIELLDYRSVPTSVDTENNHNNDRAQKNKYTVNKSPKGAVVISRPLFFLLIAAVLVLLIGAVLATFFLVPRCSETPGPATSAAVVAHNDDDRAERLRRDVLPIAYRIKIIPYIQEKNFTTKGEATITLNCTENTDRITLNVNDIHVYEDSVTVRHADEASTDDVRVSKRIYDPTAQTYTVMLSQYLLADSLYNITMKFEGHLNDLLQGFYRISYYEANTKTTKWMAATQFSPTDARRAFPCFDEPDMKARFTISIARPITMSTRSNMDISETTQVDGTEDWVWDHYKESPVMSTYLVAFLVSELQPFKYNTSTHLEGNKLDFSVWSRKEAMENTRYAGTIGPKILEYFEEYFNISYPLPKLDLVALPDFAFSAMENWGLITFRESALLFDENISTTSSKRQIATILSHELGHQWFGNLVTPEWWDDLWLKEGFAIYTEYLGVQHVHPTWKILDEMVIYEVHKSMELDSLLSSHPIHVPVYHSRQIRQIFDTISYSKGASMIRMLNHFLGEKTFKTGLINYLNSHKYENAYHDDLWDSLNVQAHIDGTLPENVTLKQIMDSWILQTGYPVLNVTRDYKNSSVTIRQERFLLAEKNKEEQLWWVPISYTTQSQFDFNNTKPKLWMENTTEIVLHNISGNWEWLYVNVKEAGYYRVNYDMNNWRLLLQYYRQFPYVCRAQIIDDTMDLARANMLDYMVPFNFLIELFKDVGQQHISLTAAFDGLNFINNMLSSTPSYGKFKDFLNVILHQLYDYVGFTEKPIDSYDLQMKRSVVLRWACILESSECIIQARQIFRNWMIHGPKYKIAPNLKSVVYCTSIREGGEAEWKFAYEQYLKTNLASEKVVLLWALGCASEPWILSRYLDYTLSNDSGIRKQDGYIVFNSVAQNVLGHTLAFDFIRTHWDELNAYYGEGYTLSYMVLSLPTYMNTEYQLSQLEDFKHDHRANLGTAERAFDQTIEEVKANVLWMKNSYNRVDDWLNLAKRQYRLKK